MIRVPLAHVLDAENNVRKGRHSSVADEKPHEAWVDRELADCEFVDERMGKRLRPTRRIVNHLERPRRTGVRDPNADGLADRLYARRSYGLASGSGIGWGR